MRNIFLWSAVLLCGLLAYSGAESKEMHMQLKNSTDFVITGLYINGLPSAASKNILAVRSVRPGAKGPYTVKRIDDCVYGAYITTQHDGIFYADIDNVCAETGSVVEIDSLSIGIDPLDSNYLLHNGSSVPIESVYYGNDFPNTLDGGNLLTETLEPGMVVPMYDKVGTNCTTSMTVTANTQDVYVEGLDRCTGLISLTNELLGID